MADRTRKRALHIATEDTYGVDPSSNGSGYTAVPCFEVGEISDELEQLETNYQNGENYPTGMIAGRDGWSLSFVTPWIGLPAAAGDAGSPSATDWLDTLLDHIFGSTASFDGEGVASATNDGVVLDSDVYAAGDFLPVYGATPGYTQWRVISSRNGSGDYDVAPNWTANPSGASVSYGSVHHRPVDAGGSSIALVYTDDSIEYTLLGGRVTSARITADVGQLVRFELSVSGDSYSLTTKASLPAAASAPAVTPLKLLRSQAMFNGTLYDTRRMAVDFGINATAEDATAAAQGRQDFDNIDMQPTFEIEPLRTDALRQLRRDVTTGALLMQFGAGALSGAVLNTTAVYAAEAHATEYSQSDDSGRARNSVTFKAVRPSAGEFFEVARA